MSGLANFFLVLVFLAGCAGTAVVWYGAAWLDRGTGVWQTAWLPLVITLAAVAVPLILWTLDLVGVI